MTRERPEACIFDLDGTLFRAETALLPAYHATFEQLRSEGLFAGPTPPEERVIGGLGQLLKDIWARVLPDASEEVRSRADQLLLENQMQRLKEGSGRFYEGVEETLRSLKQHGIRLFVASNGLEAYVKTVIEVGGLRSLFDGLYSAGEYKTATKVDLVRILLETHGVTIAWMVGDRSSDVEAGKKNDLLTIGCAYASYGKPDELQGADVVIRDFRELAPLVEATLANNA